MWTISDQEISDRDGHWRGVANLVTSYELPNFPSSARLCHAHRHEHRYLLVRMKRISRCFEALPGATDLKREGLYGPKCGPGRPGHPVRGSLFCAVRVRVVDFCMQCDAAAPE